MNIFLIFFSILIIFFKVESPQTGKHPYKELTEERVSIFLNYEVHPVDIRLWIDEVAESKIKEDKKSREPWAQVKINGILVYLVSREVDIKKISMNDKSFKYLLSKKDKEYRR